MASHRHLTFFLASCLFLGCTARDSDDVAMTTAGEGGGSTDGESTGEADTSTDTDGEDPTASGSDGESSSSDTGSSTEGNTEGDTEGEECEGPGCFIPCQELDSPPPGFTDCYDQGPGECGDATIPPDCAEDGNWVCPDGWDFGGYGEGCTFPGDE